MSLTLRQTRPTRTLLGGQAWIPHYSFTAQLWASTFYGYKGSWLIWLLRLLGTQETNRRGSLGRRLQGTGRWPGLTDAPVLRRSLVLSLIRHQHARLWASGSGCVDRALSGSTGLAVLAPPWLPARPQTLGTGHRLGTGAESVRWKRGQVGPGEA